MSEEKSNYKDSLNLPKTTFDMKANLLTREPVIQAAWKKDDLYGQIRRAREGAERFILHDGPPFANGNIHIGTALNKVLKDMVVRIKTMEGLDAPYVPGWDCHGLPIEQKVADDLGRGKAATMPATDIRRLCFAHAEKFAGLQSEQFQRLGVMGQFDNPYISMAPAYEASVLEVFAMMIERGVVYKQLKPVHWSIENRTALADAELEYQDRKDSSIYSAFEVAPNGGLPAQLNAPENEPVHLLVWTTTPWTLPANLAVAVNPAHTYGLYQVRSEAWKGHVILASEAASKVLSKLGPDVAILELGRCGGDELSSAIRALQYKHPLIPGKLCPVVPADYVTLEDGTGLVHTAPGHGMEDYGTALKQGLGIYCPVLGDGTFDDTAPAWLVGKKVWAANPLVIEFLKKAGTLVLEETITHSYPHDWRSKTPTIFRATEQWFVAVDSPIDNTRQTLRQLAMEACRREVSHGGVDFYPAWGRNRIAGMLESRPDWCISRQRSWGLPIPAFYSKAGKPLLTPASVRAVSAVFAREGSDAWFTHTPRQLLAGYDPVRDKALKNPHDFPIDELTAGADIFDVWFESGSSWYAVAMKRGLVDDIPVDLYLEGSDQHRGWFQLSLLPALGAFGKAPFKAVVTHGFVVNEDGRKISKSDPNCPTILAMLEQRGADIIRLYVASSDYQDDIRYSANLVLKAEDAYRKIRNTLRFCMGACCDFDPAHHAEEPCPHSIDLWMKMELHRLIRDVRAAFDRYEFHRAARLLYEFCTVQASSIYFSAVKDRLYCEVPNSVRRRATQTVIHNVLVSLVKLLAPILPHTCHEAWEHIPFRDTAEPHSVHLASLPDHDDEVLRLAEDIRPVTVDLMTASPDELQAGPAWTWARLLELRSAALVKLEALRNGGVKNPLDAEAVFKVRPGSGAAALVKTYLKEMEDLLGVGHARVEEIPDVAEGQAVEIEVADTRERYKRCARSWKRRPDVGSNAAYPDLSVRDAMVMKDLKG